jgi:hypothetical protein
MRRLTVFFETSACRAIDRIDAPSQIAAMIWARLTEVNVFVPLFFWWGEAFMSFKLKDYQSVLGPYIAGTLGSHGLPSSPSRRRHFSGSDHFRSAVPRSSFGEAAIGERAIGEAGHADVDDADVGDRDHEHRNDEHVVTLTRVPTRFGADVVVAALESRGIKAGAVGRRVVVFERDLATARAIIAETGDDQAADDSEAAEDDQPDLGQQ